MTDEQAAAMAGALAEVGKYMDMPVTPKQQAIIGLVACVGGIYAAKAVEIWGRVKSENAKPVDQSGVANYVEALNVSGL